MCFLLKVHATIFTVGYINISIKDFILILRYTKIPCVIIRGYVKGSLYTIGQPITDRHVAEWNAVFVDGSWRLLDPFWGACCKNPDGETVSDTSGWYLFTEPRQFLYSHYPETTEWQLVDQPINMQEFAHQVFTHNTVHFIPFDTIFYMLHLLNFSRHLLYKESSFTTLTQMLQTTNICVITLRL